MRHWLRSNNEDVLGWYGCIWPPKSMHISFQIFTSSPHIRRIGHGEEKKNTRTELTHNIDQKQEALMWHSSTTKCGRPRQVNDIYRSSTLRHGNAAVLRTYWQLMPSTGYISWFELTEMVPLITIIAIVVVSFRHAQCPVCSLFTPLVCETATTWNNTFNQQLRLLTKCAEDDAKTEWNTKWNRKPVEPLTKLFICRYSFRCRTSAAHRLCSGQIFI